MDTCIALDELALSDRRTVLMATADFRDLGDDVRQHMAFKPDDNVFQCKLLLLQALHFDLIRKIFLDKLFDSGVKRAVSGSEFAKLAFDPQRFR